MGAIISVKPESPGVKAMRLRISQRLTRRELADMAGASTHDVNLLEHNLPLRLDTKLKLLRELWSRKTHR